MAEYGSLLIRNKAKIDGTLYADYIIGSIDKVRLESLGTGKMYLVGSSTQTNASGLLTYSATYIENGILYGNGSGLTNISGTNIQSGSITSEKLAGNLTIDSLTVNNGLKVANGGITTAGDVVITGNLTVKGTTTTVDTSNLEISDKLLELGKRDETTAITGYAGIYVANYDGAHSGLLGFDKDGFAYVGDATIENGEVTDASQLQRIATINATTSGLVKYDASLKTLVPAVVGTDIIDNSTLTTTLNNYLTKEEAAQTYQPIGNYLTGITSEMISTALGGAPLLQSTFTTEISKYVTKEFANQNYVLTQNFKANYLDANKVAYETDIPTKTSQLTNDGSDGTHPFLTEHQDLSDYLLSETAASTYQTIAKAANSFTYDTATGLFALKNESGQNLTTATIDTAKGVINFTLNNETKVLTITRKDNSTLTANLTPVIPTKLSDLKNDLPTTEIPIATTSTIGGIIVGAGLSINPATGVLSTTGGGVADSVDWSGVQSRPFNSLYGQDFTVDKTTDKDGILKISDTKWATRAWIASQNYLTAATIPSEYLTETEANSLYLNKTSDKSAIDNAINAKLDSSEFETFTDETLPATYVAIYNFKTNYLDANKVAYKTEIPTELPNPQSLTVIDRNGADNTNIIYTGSEAKSVDLSKYALKTELTPQYTLPTASNTTKGGILIGYEESGTKYAVLLDENNRAYVNVPRTNTTYTAGTGLSLTGTAFSLKTATASEIGGVTVTEASNLITQINGKSINADRATKDSSGNSISGTYQTKAKAFTRVELNSQTNEITFYNDSDQLLDTITIPADKLIDHGYYDAKQQAIILVLTDNSEIVIPVADLMVSYSADNVTLKLTGTTFALSDSYKSLVDNALQPGDKIPWSDITGTPDEFVLTPATTTALGGVIIGNNITVDGTGKISVSKSNVTTALGYTPYNPGTSNETLTSDVNKLISAYDSGTLSQKYAPNRSDYVYTSTLPVHRSLTINVKSIDGTETLGTVSYNPVDDSDVVANLEIAPTKVSELENDAGYLTSTALSKYVTGSGLAANKVVLGNGSSSIKTSPYGINNNTLADNEQEIPTSHAVYETYSALQGRLKIVEDSYISETEADSRYLNKDDVPDITVTNSGVTSNQYISGITASEHNITVTKAALPAIPTNYVTTNTTQDNLSGNKTWLGIHNFKAQVNLNTNNLNGAIINTHPESSTRTSVITYFENDLTSLIARGGSCTITGITSDKPVDPLFSGDSSYYYFNVNNVNDNVVIYIKTFKNFSWGNHIGIGFGSSSWTPKNVKIELGYAAKIGDDPLAENWKTITDRTDNTLEVVDAYGTGPANESTTGTPFNAIRITISGFKHTDSRISGIWVLNYASKGLYETAVSRNGSSMYGSLTPFKNNSINLGSSSYRWKTIYGVTVDSTNINADKIVADTSLTVAGNVFSNKSATVLGTVKTLFAIGNEQLFAPNGIVFGGTAAAAGLVTRGICGVSVPDENGTCTKENLYVNYDNDSTYRPNRQLILQAGSTGVNYGNNVYQYAAVRGDALVAYVKEHTSSFGHASLVASTTEYGHIKLGSDEKIDSSGSQVYPVQLDANDNAYVSVPWTDNNTTYTAGIGLSLESGTKFVLKEATSSEIGGVTITTTSSRVNKINNLNIAATYDGAGNDIGSEIAKIKGQLSGGMHYKGTIASFSALPSGASVGDMYNVTAKFTIGSTEYPAGTNVAWNGSSWDPLGGDMSGYVANTDVATSSTLGLIKIGFPESGRNFPVELNSSNQAFVTVPAQDLSGYFKLNGNNTANGSNVFQNDAFTSGAENQVVKYRFKTGSNQYGAIYFGKEGPNNGSMIRLDQVEGTPRLYFRASSTAGAIVWNQPESGSQLYFDVSKVNFRTAGYVADAASFRPSSNGTKDLGASGNKFRNVYANAFYENGTNLSSKYLPQAGGTITGNLTINGTTALKGTVTISGAISATANAAATTSKYGFIKLGSDTQITASGKVYPVQLDSSDKAFVSVPWTDTDTKNTTGSTNNTSKLFLIGATSQDANPQTYSNSAIYATNGVLSTTKTQVGGTAVTMEYNSSDECLDFIFA